MKKLKLQALGLSADDVLTREQMKKIVGGDGGSGNRCNESCDDKNPCDTVCPHCDTGSWGSTKFCWAGA